MKVRQLQSWVLLSEGHSSKLVKIVIGSLLIMSVGLAAFWLWRSSLITTGARVEHRKDQIVFLKDPNPGPDRIGFDVYLLDVTTGNVIQLTMNRRIVLARWTADGESLILETPDGSFSLLNVGTGKLKSVTNLNPAIHLDYLTTKGRLLSPDGKQVVYATVDPSNIILAGKIIVANADGTNSRELSIGGSPTWSPDGSRIAFMAQLEGDADSEIYLIDPDGSHRQRLAANPGWDINPIWSPDGKSLSFVNGMVDSYDVLQAHELFAIRADGQGLTDLGTVPYPYSIPTWSPDSQWIAFRDDNSGGIAVTTPDGSNHILLPLGSNPVWSPDGTRIAYDRGREHTDGEICIVQYNDYHSEHCFPNTFGGQQPEWRP